MIKIYNIIEKDSNVKPDLITKSTLLKGLLKFY